MESKLYTKGGHGNRHKTGLLPRYFKWAGLAIMVLALVVPLVVVKIMAVEVAAAQKETIRLLVVNAFLLGLLFLAWARDKTEDERSLSLRYKSMGFAFIWGVLSVVLKPLTDWLFADTIADFSAQELVLSMLLVYLFLYFLQKKGVLFFSQKKGY